MTEFKLKPDLPEEDSLAGRLGLSWEWSVESTRHTSEAPRHKLCKVLEPGSAPFRKKDAVVIFVQILCNQPDKFAGL